MALGKCSSETEHSGVNRTADFAMSCYSNDDDLRYEFTMSVPGVTSGWGMQRLELVYTIHIISSSCLEPFPSSVRL